MCNRCFFSRRTVRNFVCQRVVWQLGESVVAGREEERDDVGAKRVTHASRDSLPENVAELDATKYERLQLCEVHQPKELPRQQLNK